MEASQFEFFIIERIRQLLLRGIPAKKAVLKVFNDEHAINADQSAKQAVENEKVFLKLLEDAS